jgi:phage terminase small subunit
MPAAKKKGRARGIKRDKVKDANAQLVIAAAKSNGMPIPDTTFAYMNPEDKAQRRAFVAQFVKDFDSRAACLRLGYNYSLCKTMGSQYLQCPFVQAYLDEIFNKTEIENVVSRSRVMFGLLKEATSSFFGSDRINAWKAIAKLKGMEASINVNHNLNLNGSPNRGGVMLVPAYSMSEWEVQAGTQQEALKADVRK